MGLTLHKLLPSSSTMRKSAPVSSCWLKADGRTFLRSRKHHVLVIVVVVLCFLRSGPPFARPPLACIGHVRAARHATVRCCSSPPPLSRASQPTGLQVDLLDGNRHLGRRSSLNSMLLGALVPTSLAGSQMRPAWGAEIVGIGRGLCETTLSHLAGGGSDVFLVGVAHLSNESVALVRKAVRQARPDLVMVELDSSRLTVQEQQSSDGSSRRGLMIFDPTAQQEAEAQAPPLPALVAPSLVDMVSRAARDLAAGALGFLISSLYKASEGFMGEMSGAEMLAALEEASVLGVPVLLGDRPAKITLDRLVAELGSTDIAALDEALEKEFPELYYADASPQDFQAILEGVRDQATTRRLREKFRNAAPGLFSGLVGERDEFMGRNLLKSLQAGRKRIVAVVGSIHVQGIEEYLVGAAGLRAVDACIV
mmetsp:Transcript_46945/g.150883  ORF Transcript_46945/g.150883 Transcript_46945/m.150883 type:complete len:424 (-) Transcript_46945:96-1367(-)